MLYIILGNERINKSKIEQDPDVYFDGKIVKQVIAGKLTFDRGVAKIIKNIDNSEYIAGTVDMETRFNRKIDVTYLSTGCKTAICIYLKPKICFSTLQCGDNALVEILKLEKGCCYMPICPFSENDFDVKCTILAPDGSKHICTSYSEVYELCQEWGI